MPLLPLPPPQTPVLRNPRIVGLIGHSMAAGAGAAFATPRTYSNMGPQHTFGMACLMSQGRYVIDEYSCAAISGSTTGDILAKAETGLSGKTQLEAIAGGKAGLIILDTGINDTATLAYLNGTTIPNFRTIIRTILARGQKVAVIVPAAKGDSTYTSKRTTGEATTTLFALRAWMMGAMLTEFPRDVMVFDRYSVTVNPASKNGYGDIRLGYTYDGTHLNSKGALLVDRALLAQLDEWLGWVPPAYYGGQRYPLPLRQISNAPYDATNFPMGNLLGNAGFVTRDALSVTTGGVTGTGTKPYSWFLDANQNTRDNSTLTVTTSFDADQDGDWLRVWINGTANVSQDWIAISMLHYIGNGTFSVGDVVRGAVQAELIAGSVGITNVQLDFSVQNNTSSSQGTIQGDFDKAGVDADVSTENLRLLMPGGTSVPVVNATNNSSKFSVTAYCGANTGGTFTINGGFRFRRPAMWKSSP